MGFEIYQPLGKNIQDKGPIIHIHGDRDKTFPIRNIKNVTHVINGGNHFMIYRNATEIANIFKSYI